MLMRIGQSVYLVEANAPDTRGKMFTKLVKDDMKDIITTFARAFSPSRNKQAYDKGRKRYGMLRQDFDSQLQSLLKDFLEGRITKNQFSYHVKKKFSEVYPKAFSLGAETSGIGMDLSKSDKKWVEKFKKTEFKFLNRFIADVVAKRGRMDYRDRMQMYVGTLDSVFDAGRVDAYPDEGTKIYWHLHIAEHCPDCIRMAAGSPYTPKNLPMTPRSGGTRCLSNCKCTLSIRYEPPKQLVLKHKKLETGDMLEEAIDWNVIDQAMSCLMEHSLSPSDELADEALMPLFESSERLPVGLLSDDFFVLHQIGALILAQE